jgi:hypothetical protein
MSVQNRRSAYSMWLNHSLPPEAAASGSAYLVLNISVGDLGRRALTSVRSLTVKVLTLIVSRFGLTVWK